MRVGVSQLRDFFETSSQIEAALPKIYAALGGDADPDEAIKNHQEVVRAMCDIISFATQFDDMKMVNPAVQNDLAYYRRVLSRLKREKKTSDGEIKDEVVDRMSLFYAHASPMTKTIIDATTSYVSSCDTVKATQTNMIIARINECCRFMLQNDKITDSDTQLLYLRAMTGTLLILDYTHPNGIFIKKSPVDVKNITKQKFLIYMVLYIFNENELFIYFLWLFFN